MRLDWFNPVRLLFGPIFQMEVRTAGRRTSTYVFRALVGASILTFFGVTLLSLWSEVSYEQSAFARIQAGQNIAPTLVAFIMWTQYVALVLLAPLITGPALCDERRDRTMAALLTTPLTAWQIVLGKLTGRLSQAVILALVAVPMVFAARMLGGLSVEGIVASVTLTIVSVFMCASLALLFSAFSPRATTAATAAFVIFLCFNFGPLALGAMYLSWVRPHFPSLPTIPFEWALYTSLPIALGVVVFEHFFREPSGFSSWQLWGFACVYGLGIGVGAVTLAGLQLRRAMRTDPESLMDRPVRKQKKKRRERRGSPAIADADPGTAEQAESVSATVGDRPVLWREMRIGAFRKKRRLIEAALALALIFGLMYLNGGMQEQAAHMLIVDIGVLILMIQAIFGGTGAIAHERQSRTLDVLMTTPLRPSAIVLGKAAGVFRRLWFVPLAVGIHMTLGVFAGVFHPVVLPLLAAAVLPSTAMLVCTGVLMSVLFRKAVSASVANLFFALTLYAGIPLLLAIFQNMLDLWGDSWFGSILTGAFSINPIVMGTLAIAGTGSPFNWMDTGTASLEFNMPNTTLTLAQFVSTVSIAAALELAVAAGAVLLAARMLPERYGRAS